MPISHCGVCNLGSWSTHYPQLSKPHEADQVSPCSAQAEDFETGHMLCRRQAKRQRVASHTPLQPMSMPSQGQAAYPAPVQPYNPPAAQYQPAPEQYPQPGMEAPGVP